MFRAAYRSSSGTLIVFAASGLHMHVVTGRSQVCVGTGQFPLRLNYGQVTTCICKPEAANTVMPLETRSAFNERWNNKFYYKVASCGYFY
jgi:hypothetical protein